MKIIRPNHYEKANREYPHLFNIGTVPNEMEKDNIDWLVRDKFDAAGTFMLGDLRVVKTQMKVMEIHPFPEWVVQIFQPLKDSNNTYLIIPNIDQNQFIRAKKKSWEERTAFFLNFLFALNHGDYIAIEYRDGVSIKVPANVPHDFIYKENGKKSVPYCQVFEPDFEKIGKLYQISPTHIFKLGYSLKIES